MKHKLFLFVILIMAIDARAQQPYDFSAVAPSGQTLYYKTYLILQNGNYIHCAKIVQPTGYPYWRGITKPSGNLEIPSSVTYNGQTYSVRRIGKFAFTSCSGITSVSFPSSIEYIDTAAFEYCSGLTSLVIPDSVTIIRKDAFLQCNNVSSLTLGNMVSTIGDYAFEACTGLTTVNIPASVTSIGLGVFANCRLSSIVVASGNPQYDSRNNCNAIIQTNWNKLIQACDSTIIPDSIFSIGDYAFYLVRPNSIIIPNSVTYIGDHAFDGSSVLTSVVIPASVVSIGQFAFSNCSSLTSVTIGSGVTSIGYKAFFYFCPLSLVTMNPINPPYLSVDVFPSSALFLIPCGSYSSYSTASSWRDYVSKLRYPTTGFNISLLINQDENHGTMGSVSLEEDNGCDNTIVVHAEPYGCYQFDHWSTGSTDNPITLQIDSDTTITAFFAEEQFSIYARSENEEQGTVTGSGIYHCGESITLTAEPTPGYHFTHWTKGNRTITDNPLQVYVSESATYTAHFAISYYTVNVSSSDILRGTVHGGGTNYTYGDAATVSAEAYSGYVFSQWSNGAYYNSYTFAVTEDVDLVADFVAVGTMFRITTEANNVALGHVEGGGMYGVGEYATLTAIPNENCWFEHWEDGSTGNPRQVYVGCDATYTAYFASPGVGISETDTFPAITVYVVGGRIVVDGAEGETVTVYDMIGRLTQTFRHSSNQDLPGGVYLVKVGDFPARKVVVIR